MPFPLLQVGSGLPAYISAPPPFAADTRWQLQRRQSATRDPPFCASLLASSLDYWHIFKGHELGNVNGDLGGGRRWRRELGPLQALLAGSQIAIPHIQHPIVLGI